jgi:hypothetical protein
MWQLHGQRPCVQVDLTLASSGQPVTRVLLADTGAGSGRARFDLLLRDTDCLSCGGIAIGTVVLGRAYTGPHPLYRIPVRIPALGFGGDVEVVGIANPPVGFDGTAGFRFLNRFTYGNFGDATKFGLEC